jgi:HSP20 family protein
MSLIRHANRPGSGSLLSDLFDDERFLFSPWLRGQHMPAVNIKENEKSYEIELAAAGYNKKDFNISIDNGLLTISAEKKEETDKKEDNYQRKEFSCTSFSRSFNLPENVAEEDVQARFEDGVLKLSITKKAEPQPKPKKPIEIK